MSAVAQDVTSPACPFAIGLIADGTVGYAALQNDVPLIRELSITNTSAGTLTDIEVLISAEPVFAELTLLRFDRLAAGETRRLAPLDIKVSHAYLASLTELERGRLVIEVRVAGNSVQRAEHPIEVLAYDQWAGIRALPELLAAFCMPNDPAVDSLVSKAAVLLQSHDGVAMTGYQTKNRDHVWLQVAALYAAIANEQLQYANPPASFGDGGQKIRTPDRMLAGRLGTCLDLAMLLASCLEQAGLHPVVLFQRDHAWVGCWLVAQSFPTPSIDDVQAVRKRVQSGELIVIEATLLCGSDAPALTAAASAGFQHLTEESLFRFAIDISRARERRILPLPSRGTAAAPERIRRTTAAMTLEAVPPLPPLDPSGVQSDFEPTADTPEGRLARWKSRLLDLSLRNRLLNFKPAKTNIQLLIPDVAALEDALFSGAEFRFQALPQLMEGVDPRVSAVHVARNGQQPLEETARDHLRRKELLAMISTDKLDDRLLEIFTSAKLSLEEGGSNTLFLAIGLLRWTEEAGAATSHLAPLLLVPVTMDRKSVRSGFTLTRHDDDALVNPTLLQLLQNEYALTFRGLDPLPKDDHGVDVEKIWQVFRLAVGEIQGWEVVPQVHLGTFAFTKYLMWKDLQDRTAALRQNRVVAHLMDHPGETFASSGIRSIDKNLDDAYQPQELFTPMLADSSQLQAVCTAADGHDMVLEGPPGTGKSQTITNLITHFLARGKTVLFVSEKMAALDVVHRRLQSMGLGPFCLELHSAKARKTDVVKQLGTALGFAATQTQADWERGATRLAGLRQELNQFVRILHHRHPNDLTVYGATGLSVLKRDWVPAEMPWSDPDVHDRAALDGLRELVRQMHVASSDLGLRGHPLEPIAWADWAPGREGELYSTAASLDQALVVLDETMQSLAKVLPMAAAASLQDYAWLDILIEVLLAAPGIPAGMAARAVDQAVHQELRVLRQHNEARASLWTAFDGSYRSDIASLDGNEMAAAWQRATSAWWPQRWLATRQIARQFQKFRTDAKVPAASEVEALLPKLQGLNREDAALAALASAAAALLDGTYQGTQTDWGAIERFAAWTRSYVDATLRFANGDPAQLDLIRTKTLPLVGAHRALIAPATPIGTSLQRFRESYRNFMAKLDSVERLANCPGALAGDPHTPGVNARLRAVLQRWHGARRQQLRAWCAWQAIRSRASAEGLDKLIEALETDGIAANKLSEYFEFSYQCWWLKGIIDREPILRSFMSADHERKIREFRSADEEFQRLTREYVIATLAGRIPHAAVQTSPDSEMGRLRRQMQMQRGLQPVRTLIQNLPTLLPKLKPVMLMSPLSVAQYLDAGHPAFDLVVFDEASQISVWDAVGAIARGKQLVVVGDPKQLPPTTFFASTESTNDAPQADQDVKDLESILDECLGAGLHQLSLDWHYRSRHESLITFSNVRYYDSRLITFPSPVTRDTAVSFRAVTGSYDRGASRTNRAEADAIVEEIAAHYRDAVRRRKSLGVVTFNQPQRALIEALLDERRRRDDELDRILSEAGNEALFIKNLENVQGDERDVILFSITYGPDRAGHVTMNFGPLNLEGGHRRLNVAITRARDQVIIFSTLQPDQIDAARASAPGVIDLKNYLDFAKRGPKALIEQSLPTGLEPESPFEVAVLSALRDRGWIVHPQVGCTGFRIDMAVVDPRAPGRYLLGVECDGRMYHSGANARDRDRLRQLVLEGLGWRLHRIWSTDWWTDSDGQIEKLDALLKTILTTPPASMPPQPQAAPVTLVDTSMVKPGAEAPVALALPAMPVYAPVAIEGGAADDFYLPRSTSLLTAQLQEIINREGPIAEDVLFRRLARAWSLGRTGARITARLTSLARGNAILDPDGRRFYWPNIDRSAWRKFRLSDGSEASKRHIDELALEECANIADYLLDQGGSTSLHDLARNVCQSVGMARITADAETRAQKGIESLLAQGRATNDGGRIRKN
jgi:very-short-patch-repair endonuclease